MSWIPKLSDREIQELASQIPHGLEKPQLSTLNALFMEGFGYSQFKNLYERLNAYIGDYKNINKTERSALWNLISSLLQRFREKRVLSDKDYDAEFDRCKLILFPKV